MIFFNGFSDKNINAEPLSIVVLVIQFGIFFLLIPFVLLFAYSLKIYKQIKNRLKTNWPWGNNSNAFFLPFLYLKTWKNKFNAEKEIKNIEEKKIDYDDNLIDQNKINWLFYKFTITKNIFHFIFLTFFIITLPLIILEDKIFYNKVLVIISLLPLASSTSLYFFFICPCYLANFANFVKKPKHWFLYILDFFIPTVSIYNLIKYRKNKTILT
ncbi:hypothetical protein DR085_00515 [Mycoplasma flocculare]|uniref:hypothetical protein n=1 Tax=Mesomycoplasma flocculare TaxID=2128 RepID=UPI00136FD34F|nr:hypothetical protein [Mesomycoplasma flocculare]MXR13365.1 hypothetical protein [Mesomycoplasma flocculare]